MYTHYEQVDGNEEKREVFAEHKRQFSLLDFYLALFMYLIFCCFVLAKSAYHGCKKIKTD